ncbi:MAG TPA: response regulator transcription factor [Terriglobales bacterium]|nr:response regulator transcription factor [Terriglobales bacterium]
MITVVVVDDHRLVRAGLEQLLALTDDIRVVGSAADGSTAIPLVAERRPDLVLMDISMPGVDGIETTRALLAQDPSTRVLVLTSVSDQERILESIQAGALGYLMKDAEPDELFDRIRSAVDPCEQGCR